MNETGNTAYISAETVPPAPAGSKGSTDAVERVAKAIYEARNGPGCMPWSNRPTGHKDPYRADARAAIAAMPGWQPIETAPKDGTFVLVSEVSGGSVGEAYYDYHGTREWWWANTSDGDYPSPRQPYPTHWQPLPAPPEVEP